MLGARKSRGRQDSQTVSVLGDFHLAPPLPLEEAPHFAGFCERKQGTHNKQERAPYFIRVNPTRPQWEERTCIMEHLFTQIDTQGLKGSWEEVLL